MLSTHVSLFWICLWAHYRVHYIELESALVWGYNLTDLHEWYFGTCFKQNVLTKNHLLAWNKDILLKYGLLALCFWVLIYFNLAQFSVNIYLLFIHLIMQTSKHTSCTQGPVICLDICGCSFTCYLWPTQYHSYPYMFWKVFLVLLWSTKTFTLIIA